MTVRRQRLIENKGAADMIVHGVHVVRVAIAHDDVGVPDVEAVVGLLAGRISESDRAVMVPQPPAAASACRMRQPEPFPGGDDL